MSRQCEHCRGRDPRPQWVAGGAAFVDYEDGSGALVRRWYCSWACQDAAEPQWTEQGAEVRRLRREAGMSLRDAARLLGVSCVELSKIERGYMAPDEARRKLIEVRRKVFKGAP